jgi:UDP-2,4-diacetamido-2,4,6-trideoxy-beta-L-altropyranose hydrolase
MKVFILTEGGKYIGFGHITRCIALYQVFEEKGIVPEFIVNDDGLAATLLTGKNYKISNWIEKRDEMFRYINGADIIIIDSYLAGLELYKSVSSLTKLPVYIDDNKRLDFPRGVVINGSLYAEEINYPKRDGFIYLLGCQYMPLRKEFWDVPEKVINENIKTVLVTFGATDARNLIPKVLKLLNEGYPELIKNVIVGNGFKNLEEIKVLKTPKTELIYCSTAKEMKEVMLESDIAISACGQTLYELARVGVPTIAMAIVDNQFYNANSWQRSGFISYAGWWERNKTLDNVKSSLELLKDKKVRNKMSKIGSALIDGKGSRRVVEEVIKTTLK